MEDNVAVARGLTPDTGVVLRNYHAPARKELARTLASTLPAPHRTLFIAGSPSLAHRVGAAGVHLPERQITEALEIRRMFPRLTISTSCHSLPALLRAAQVPVDLVFLSPLFTTQSHPSAHPLGPIKFANLVSQTARSSKLSPAIFALGGITPSNLHRLRAARADGYAAIGMFLS